MFQNIAEEEKQEDVKVEEAKANKIDIKEILTKTFTKQNILLYIIAFMLSTVNTPFDIAPFGLAIFAATLSNGLPAGIVFIISLIRNSNWTRKWRGINFYISFTCIHSYGTHI